MQENAWYVLCHIHPFISWMQSSQYLLPLVTHWTNDVWSMINFRCIHRITVLKHPSIYRASAGAFSKSEEDVHTCFTRFGSRKSFLATVAVSTNRWPLLDAPLKRFQVAHAQHRIWFKKYNEPLCVMWRHVPAADCVFSSWQEFVSTHLRTSQLCVNKVNSERM